jgi:transposase
MKLKKMKSIIKILVPSEEVNFLKKENHRLASENEKLKSEIITLKDKLNINSSNSGLPTSKEIYKIEKKEKKKSNKKPGGQLGHQFNGYKMKNPDVIEERESSKTKCECGGALVTEDNYVAHQNVEIPVIKPIITEYRLHHKSCVVCKKQYKATLDSTKLLGQHAEVIISSLGGFFNNSKRDIQSILSQIFNIDISLGLISNTESRVSDALEREYNQLIDIAHKSKSLHMDETGYNKIGKRQWCWLLANKTVTVFKLAHSRGRKILESLIPEYTGDVISDRYAVYSHYNKGKRQICLAHLQRDFKRFAHSKNHPLSILGKSLLEAINLIFVTNQLYKENEIKRFNYLRRIVTIKKQMYLDLKQVENIANADHAHRVAKNILKSFDMMWLFVRKEGIDCTNNFAERQIKHFVKYRKNSYFTWSDRGDRFIERMKSIYASSKLQNHNPFKQLMGYVKNYQ